MMTKVFSIYDSKGQIFGNPFNMPTTGMAVRAFNDLVNDKNTTVNRHPSDFVLYQIAEFDDQTGEYKNVNPHSMLGTASDYKKEEPKPIDFSSILKTEVKENVA